MPLVSTVGLRAAIIEELRKDGDWLTNANLTNRLAWLIPPEASARRSMQKTNSGRKADANLIGRAMCYITKTKRIERRMRQDGRWEYRYVNHAQQGE